ncbi:alpha/beta hydrolase [Devosia rhizoryzae]|uniref:Alpha/beta hydrolase n=1 Tax=Devosia rhizoryzae TaxID=2774137 RepID=A0ABX7C5D1_9HYPH|nr:alpha/beta hydrolase [Devosia rhizoryzae]QQR39454.1 alpha/beta hydrolase [Devosia rhizoryzae]
MKLSPLDILGFLLPKDGGSERVAQDLAYGPEARHRLDIYAPRRMLVPAPPVVVFFYGGSWGTGNKEAYGFVGRALAALGYVVVVPDYRLVPDIEYPAFLDDCARAVGWVGQNINRYGGDWTRMALAGHSAGAYNAVMTALDPRLVEAHGQRQAICGVIGLSGPYDFFPFDGPISLRVFGGVEDPKATQPVNHVAPGAPPMFFGHGDKDTLVLPRNSFRLAEKLQQVGSRAETRIYKGLAHAGPLLSIGLPLRWRAPVLADMATFLRELFGPSR